MSHLLRLLAALPDPADLKDHRWSALALVVANLLPLAGVLLFGWKTFDVVFAYWLENVVIGLVNVLKMLTCFPNRESFQSFYEQQLESRRGLRPGTLSAEEKEQAFNVAEGLGWQASKLFFVPFFTVHYGGFCLGHGLFICALTGDGADPMTIARETFQRPAMWAVAGVMLTSHLVSYFSNYLGRGEYRRLTPPELMFQPYGRVVLLHVALLGGAFLTMGLGSPTWVLVLLVVGKTLFDLKLHLREHRGGAGLEALGDC